MAAVYSVVPEGNEMSLFEKFIAENEDNHEAELTEILDRLHAIGHDVGARAQFFKHNEGKPGDLVCALYDNEDRKLRLYCIRQGSVTVILGGGGPKEVRSWQDDPKLKKEAETMISISNRIYQAIKDKDITFGPGGELFGNLTLNDEDDE